MKLQLATPQTIGDLGRQIIVDELELKEVSFNLAPSSGAGALVSVTLWHRNSGHQVHFVYEDAAATAAFWNVVSGLRTAGKPWPQLLLERLQADGRLPAGTIV